MHGSAFEARRFGLHGDVSFMQRFAHAQHGLSANEAVKHKPRGLPRSWYTGRRVERG